MRISMNKVLISKSLIHLYTAIGFAVISIIFYSPLLDGKKLYQSDINQLLIEKKFRYLCLGKFKKIERISQMKYTG